MSRSWSAVVVVLLCAGCAQKVPIEVTVNVPSEPRTGTDVLLTTDDAELGAEVATSKKNGLTFTTTLQVPDGETVTLGAKLSTGVAALDAEWKVLAVPVTADADAPEPQSVLLQVKRWDVLVPEGSVRTRFVVRIPEYSPVDARVYLSGPSAELGGGRVTGHALSLEPDGTHVAVVALPQGVAAEYTYNLGASDNYEVDAAGTRVVRTVTPVGPLQTVEDTVARWSRQSLTGNIHTHTLEWAAKSTRRRILVYLPPGYDAEPTRRYPVLYMHDGQNLMDNLTAPSSFGEWRVDETAEALITAATVEPVIIVGVYHGYSERIAEYTHVASAPYGGGQAEQYRAFLTQVVKPFVDQTYRTKPEAQQTGVAGSSLGGLVSMWLGLVEPDVFGRLGVISPSVWWANRDIVTRVAALDAKLPLRIWLDMGTNESSTAIDDARALRDALLAEGWALDTDLRYVEVAGANHSESAWRGRFGDILTFLYPAP